MEDPIKEITKFFEVTFNEKLDMYKANSYDFCALKRIKDFIVKEQKKTEILYF